MIVVSASAAVPPVAPGEARGHFYGSKWEYRRILWGAMFALIVTLGLHRFTVTTNIRRYLWSRTDLGGEQLDYTGDAIELLLGFLFLVVVLAPLIVAFAIYAWIVGEGEVLAQFAPFILLYLLAVLGLYQARRYRLSHTVFRGICFRQTGSAWVYFLLILLWTVVVTITVGLAYPWARAHLERYKMRHTHWGDLRGRFEGSAWVLFKRGFLPWLAALLLAFGLPLLAEQYVPAGQEAVVVLLTTIWQVLLLLGFYPIFRAMVVRWRIAGMRFGDLSFESNFSTWRFAKPYLKFYAWMLLLVTVVFLLAIGVYVVVIPALPIGMSLAVEIIGTAILVAAYFAIATIISFAFQGTIRFENWRLILDSLVIRGIDQLDRVNAPASAPSRRQGRVSAALNLGGF